MRIIRFRGKRIDGKGFAFGSLILPNSENENTYIQGWNSAKFKVIKESVGQFTGLYDKNGKEIYEGDIVSYNRTIQNYDDDDILNPRYYKTPQYETKSFKSDVKYMYNSFTIMDNSKWNDLQVIGNIYENPELLTD